MLGDELRRQLAVGIDPVKHACTEKQARPVAAENSFKTVAIKWSGTWKPVRSAQHADQVMRRFEADAFPQNRAIPVTVVAATALMAMLNAIQAAPTPCTCSARKIRSSVSIRPKWLLQHSQLSTGGSPQPGRQAGTVQSPIDNARRPEPNLRTLSMDVTLKDSSCRSPLFFVLTCRRWYRRPRGTST